MKRNYDSIGLFFFMFFGLTGLQAQDLHHQALSAQGNSVVLPNGMYVSQTIGQQSVVGNQEVAGKMVGQGFQQALWDNYIKMNAQNSMTTITYPNPFVETVHFQFSQPLDGLITIAVFDIRGRLIFQDEQIAENQLLTLNLEHLPASNYLVQLTASDYSYYSQIIKKQ